MGESPPPEAEYWKQYTTSQIYGGGVLANVINIRNAAMYFLNN